MLTANAVAMPGFGAEEGRGSAEMGENNFELHVLRDIIKCMQ